ncbi:PREDICTED: ubiquinol-cytochrome-c reductase complex assembly factor 1 isoform X4 [Dipodomys ordii]|uniref:Ubiquinol-cytochrome-c reductase complex assembly factor 1 isoform X4 n=1 Tax=Dipodomys ordii TaxID=10020 RepID=A0A1S3EQ87_DIPOR|nr:PREDICTED: ubiquinol-cytochrome-c reductase complex assembly factor 1 isoform X4 [Dipodomys ordii]
MALLVRVLRNYTNISQWVPVCSRLFPVCPIQGQWGRTLSGTSQWPQMSQSQTCSGAEEIPGIDVQQSRKYYTPNKLPTIKDFPQPVEEKVGIFTKIIEAMGFTGPLKYSKWKIKIAALRMYTSCVEKTDFEEFFLRCQMPDTFNSWFLITLLHVWMCLVRMKQEGRSGKYMCRIIVHFMWEDVEQRGRIMGGILSDDHGLAAALWRTFFNQQCEDPRQLELLVEYVRKQMQYLDSIDGEDLLLTGEVSWRPLVEKNPQSILKPQTPTYNDEGL